MAVNLTKLGACAVQSAVGGNSVNLESFWNESSCIVSLFRRFGCKFCRLEASNLSKLKPALDAQNVKLIGISFDKDGLQEFVDGKFFSGDLYLDPEKITYNTLGYKPVSMFSGMWSLFTKAGRDLNSQANASNIQGNLSGDGWQTGGLLVIGKGGKVLYSFTQEKVVNHPDYGQIMQVLNIDAKKYPELAQLSSTSTAQCDQDACSR